MMKPLRSLKGVGDKTEKLFQKIGVITTEDLLEYFPRNYDAYEEPVTSRQSFQGSDCRCFWYGYFQCICK